MRLGLSLGAVSVSGSEPFRERHAGSRANSVPLIMAALVVVNEPLVARVVNDFVSQYRIPTFGKRSAAPTRLSTAQQAGKKRAVPNWAGTGRWQNAGDAISQFGRNRLLNGLHWLGNSVDPECERSRFQQVGDGCIEARRLHHSQSMNGASFLGSRTGEAVGGENIRRPLLQRRPPDWCRMVPVGLCALPRRPGLLGSEIFICVVHQGIEPALGSRRGESVSVDPIFQRLPNGKASLAAVVLQESGASSVQFGAHRLRKVVCGFGNHPNPQNDHVPFCESRCVLCQLLPRH